MNALVRGKGSIESEEDASKSWMGKGLERCESRLDKDSDGARARGKRIGFGTEEEEEVRNLVELAVVGAGSRVAVVERDRIARGSARDTSAGFGQRIEVDLAFAFEGETGEEVGRTAVAFAAVEGKGRVGRCEEEVEAGNLVDSSEVEYSEVVLSKNVVVIGSDLEEKNE